VPPARFCRHPDGEITNGEAASQLQQPSLSDQMDGGLRLSHEIDVEVGRHSQRHGAQLPQDQQVEANVRKPDQRRPRHGAARPQMLLAGRKAKTGRLVVEMLDRHAG